MRIHIIGIGTTFMTGLAVLARQAGHDVSGSDSCFDVPTRRQLSEIGVMLKEGFSPSNLDDKPELVIIGNELAITNTELLEARHRSIPYISGPLWLEEYVLHDKWAKSIPPHFGEEPLEKHEKEKPHAPPKPSEKPVIVKHAPKIPPDPHSKLKRTSH
jgi:UDP-N-acetylmuramate: L-alanyl-gamma-D-glutamyl-meso-diaminopimelate ligase